MPVRSTAALVACVVLVCCAALVVPGCDSGGDPSPGLPTGGDGVLTLSGEASAYRVVGEESRILLVVYSTNSSCHTHVVEAESVAFDFHLDDGDMPGSFLEAVIDVAALEPDADENRALFPETRDENLSETSRNTIRNNVRGQLSADEFPEIGVRAEGFNAILGSGVTQVDVNMRGATSTVTMAFDSAFDGDDLRVTASGTIDGALHDVPNGFGATCLAPEMLLDLVLVLEPAPPEE